MPPTLVVVPADLLAATHRLRRLGNRAALERLELTQPDLTEVLLTGSADVHRRLARCRLDPLVVRRLTRRVENLGLTLVDAVLVAAARQAHHRLGLPPRL